MNTRENFMALINHQKTEWMPLLMTDNAFPGGQLEWWKNGPTESGLDGFGNGWILAESAGGQSALDPEIQCKNGLLFAIVTQKSDAPSPAYM